MSTPTIPLLAHDHEVRSLREHLVERAGAEHPPAFEPSDDPALRAFTRLAEDNDFYSLDANRERAASPAAQFATYWHCTVVGFDGPDSAAERFCTYWSPVRPGQEPLTGFGGGPDSTLVGAFARTAVPDDWRSRALLLVVTTPFVHLSYERQPGGRLVRGAMEDGSYDYRYLRLVG
jgi:hypothetical protein